ncbi:MAG: hypothetical protein E6575_15365 [Bradyrhizobium sp.]|nr:hypothetical protein [Bradyrhizobium sp.]
MISDPDARVRLEIAERLAPDLLTAMRKDSDWRVRHEVASRIALSELHELAKDEDPLVREMARGRLDNRSGAAMEKPA